MKKILITVSSVMCSIMIIAACATFNKYLTDHRSVENDDLVTEFQCTQEPQEQKDATHEENNIASDEPLEKPDELRQDSDETEYDWENIDFVLSGRAFSFSDGIKESDLNDLGWTLKYYENYANWKTLGHLDYTSSSLSYTNPNYRNNLCIRYCNPYTDTRYVRNGIVKTISYNALFPDDNPLIGVKGIYIGDSENKIKEILGEPDDFSDIGNVHTYTYDSKDGLYIELKTTDSTVYGLEIRWIGWNE